MSESQMSDAAHEVTEPVPAPVPATAVKSVSAWAALKATPAVYRRVVCRRGGWSDDPQQEEAYVTEAQYDAALAQVRGIRLG